MNITKIYNKFELCAYLLKRNYTYIILNRLKSRISIDPSINYIKKIPQKKKKKSFPLFSSLYN